MDALHSTGEDPHADAITGAAQRRVADAELAIGRIDAALARYAALDVSPTRAPVLQAARVTDVKTALRLLGLVGATADEYLALGDRAVRTGSTSIAVDAYERAGASERIAELGYAELARGSGSGLDLLERSGQPVDAPAVLAFAEQALAPGARLEPYLACAVAAYDLLHLPPPVERLRAALDHRLAQDSAYSWDVQVLHERFGVVPDRAITVAWARRQSISNAVHALRLVSAHDEIARVAREYLATEEYEVAIRLLALADATDALRSVAAELWRRRNSVPARYEDARGVIVARRLAHVRQALEAIQATAELEAHAATLVSEHDIDGARTFFAAAIRITTTPRPVDPWA